LIGGLILVALALVGLVFKEFDFPAMGFSTWIMFGKNGIVPKWLAVPGYLIAGLLLIYMAFAK
jgi:hypothetical protein